MNDDCASQSAEPPGRLSVDLPFINPASAKRPSNARNLVIGPRARLFRERFFPAVTDFDWNDWHWQLRNRITDLRTLERFLQVSEDERLALEQHSGPLPVGITPYYASLLDEVNPTQPLRRTVVMVTAEHFRVPGEADDPLGEDHSSPVPGLVHRYPDRVLFLVTGFCSVYCRYCTRSRMVGNPGGEYRFNTKQWDRALEYIAAHKEIRDVLLSGGDPSDTGRQSSGMAVVPASPNPACRVPADRDESPVGSSATGDARAHSHVAQVPSALDEYSLYPSG